MGLFNKSQIDQINAIAQKSKTIQPQTNVKKVSTINDELQSSSKLVQEYFKDSPAILIENKIQLHDYISKAIEASYVSIDTETTGLDRSKDYIVGASLYYPGGVECYIPMKHKIPIFEDLYKNQLTYEEVQVEFERFIAANSKLIFANANFDLYMISKDIKVNLDACCYYDVILAWRCLKEDELHNGLKELYNKYVLKGHGDPKRFSDFFSPQLFPYCKPEIAKLYAANDAKITYELFQWQLPFTLKNSKVCQKNNLMNIADLIWHVEFPLISIIQEIERTGMYIDLDIANSLKQKYHTIYDRELNTLKSMVQNVLDNSVVVSSKKPPFSSGGEFNPRSPLHVKYLCYDLLQLPKPQGKESTGVNVLAEFNQPITNKIVEVRSLATNISTFVDKLPNAIESDGKIHSDFWQIGAGTGRMSCIAQGTNIATSTGLKPIEEIKTGDLVFCYSDDNEFTSSLVLGTYFTGIRPCIKVHWIDPDNPENFGYLICTSDHFIRAEFGYVEACKIRYQEDSDYILASYDLKPAKAIVTSIESLDDVYAVYDIAVASHHNFIANGLCVHNSRNPNLMNIPSKLDDIRHMFRASPASYDIQNLDDSNTIELPIYYQLKSSSGEYVAVDTLHQGDFVALIDDNNDERFVEIESIQLNFNQPNAVIKFSV